ncbi:MAG: acetyl-CoA carboxylase biotin carboxyl carrier protein [Alphaproteobacteria bacterium]|nr:acetyl-CoA carboxylase biotin carboxyl carrier protein [Alphaproteobacteria bacterium]OJV47671.1 MAG: hypothetical protein BGO28_06765 [Alphaproteobacteria bacterium 43-37]
MTNRFDIDSGAVKALAELLNSTGLNEIEYEVEAGRIRVVKGVPHQPAMVSAPVQPIAAQSGLREDGPPSSVRPTSDHPGAVKSPMVGTAYLASAPGAALFIKEGDSVNKGDTLLIIEAMKVMNPIRAPQSGRVAQVLIKDTEPVEFGTVLVIIE